MQEKKWFQKELFRILVDMHIPDWDSRFLRDFSPERYADMMALAGVDTAEIYNFVAASYNSGPGHILDAMALCKKYEEDATRWEKVAEYLALKSHKEYYNDPVVKCGYYPGKHTIHYVEEVMNRYKGYVITKQEE